MISEIKGNYVYLKPDYKEKNSVISLILNSDYLSDIILDLSSIEIIDESFVFSLNQINQFTHSKGFCLVIVLKEALHSADIEYLNIVPTLMEGLDYIQIEQIQRQLG